MYIWIRVQVSIRIVKMFPLFDDVCQYCTKFGIDRSVCCVVTRPLVSSSRMVTIYEK